MKEYRDGCGAAVNIGNVYRELRHLLDAGWIRSTSRAADADPRQEPYEITASGRAAFDRWLTEFTIVPASDHHDALAVRVFIASSASGALSADILERWRRVLAAQAAVLEDAQSILRSRVESQDAQARLLTGRRLKHVSMDLEFLSEVRSAYDPGTSCEREAVAPRPVVSRRVAKGRSRDRTETSLVN
jgi:DNA-binding PadR family transcriptional regulator